MSNPRKNGLNSSEVVVATQPLVKSVRTTEASMDLATDSGNQKLGTLRRFWAHITRSRARGALLLVMLSILIYAVIPNKAGTEPLRQFALIVGSVAASAIFLPEFSTNIWAMTAEQFRTLVPEGQRRTLARSLIGAESPDTQWNDLVYTEALAPLLEAGRSPWLTMKNLNYIVRIRLNQPLSTGEGQSLVHNVDTVLSAERVLPQPVGDGSYWLSIARTPTALSGEFEQLHCLGREHVTFDSVEGEEWYNTVLQACNVRIVINGQVQQVEADSFDGGMPDVVRFRFRPEVDSLNERVPIRMSFDFPIPSSDSTFPVVFSGYYCAGATVVTVKVHHGQRGAALICHPFFARRLGFHRDRNQVVSNAGSTWDEMSFSTGRDSVMWPGSGVLFSWQEGSRSGLSTDLQVGETS